MCLPAVFFRTVQLRGRHPRKKEPVETSILTSITRWRRSITVRMRSVLIMLYSTLLATLASSTPLVDLGYSVYRGVLDQEHKINSFKG